MISLSLLYTNTNDFIQFLSSNQFDTQADCFVRIYTAVFTKTQAVGVAKEVKAVLPNAKIIGGSGCGVVYHGKQFDNDTLIVIEHFDNPNINVLINTHCFTEKSASKLAREIAANYLNSQVDVMHILCGDKYQDLDNLVEELNVICPHIKLVGGIVGDILSKNIDGFVFTDEDTVYNGIITATICGNLKNVFIEVSTSSEPISPAYTINTSHERFILEIEGKSATAWCREQFGLEDLKSYSSWQLIAENDALVRFPMVLEGHGGAGRFIRYDAESNEMVVYHSRINSGTVFRIGYTSPTKCVQECFDICNKLATAPVESLFCYTCLFRKLYLGNCAEWELRPFTEYNICGVFMMGEVSYLNGRNELLNGSNCLLGLTEKTSHLMPNLSVFEDLYNIQDDNEKLFNFVLQKQSVAMSRENEQLLKKLLIQQEKAELQLYRDNNTGIFNSIKFSQDSQTHLFDKMCIIQIDNADLLTGRFGKERYYEMVNIAMDMIRNYVDTYDLLIEPFYYMLNDSTIFFTTTNELPESVFINIVHAVYDKYQFISLHNKNELLVNRFVLVLHKKNMLEKGLATLQNAKHMQTHFLICDNSSDNSILMNDDIGMLQIINDAIANDCVIPYFQGIHDNNVGKINKYEALMRIKDRDGTVHPPADFMDVAKRYHLYSKLSISMIGKVFDLFEDKDCDVSINLSAYDINFETTRNFIFNRLEAMGTASNFVFEILEDEKFRDVDTLKTFINKARQYGVRIAIDDFGSGYSNFMELARTEPDFIKVDASIIKYIDSNIIHRKVLESIVFLGNKLEADMVAEFVENEDIQTILEKLNIHFSQGYLFAKPLPFEEIEI